MRRFFERHHWPTEIAPDKRTTFVICAGSGSEMVASLREGRNVVGVDYSRTMHAAQNQRLQQFTDFEFQRAALAHSACGKNASSLYSMLENQAKAAPVEDQQVGRNQLFSFAGSLKDTFDSAAEQQLVQLYLFAGYPDSQVPDLLAKSRRLLISALTGFSVAEMWDSIVQAYPEGSDSFVMMEKLYSAVEHPQGIPPVLADTSGAVSKIDQVAAAVNAFHSWTLECWKFAPVTDWPPQQAK